MIRSFDTNPVEITKKVAMGISKAKPKAKPIIDVIPIGSNRNNADDVQITGVNLNTSTDMDFWNDQSANELRAQIALRIGRQGKWKEKIAVGHGLQGLRQVIKEMIDAGVW